MINDALSRFVFDYMMLCNAEVFMVIKYAKQFLLSSAMFMAVVTFHLSQVSAPKVVKVHELKLEEQMIQHAKLEVAENTIKAKQLKKKI